MKRTDAAPDPTEQLPAAVIVHSVSMARAALALGQRVTLLSARGAALYAGVGWWRSLVNAAGAGDMPDILDCGHAPGRALEALRVGQRRLVLRAPALVWADIADRASRRGGVLLREPPEALDLAKPGAERLLAGWLVQPRSTRLPP